MGLRERSTYCSLYLLGRYLSSIRFILFYWLRCSTIYLPSLARSRHLLPLPAVLTRCSHGVQNINGTHTSQPFEVHEPPRDESERPKPVPGTSAAQSRRAKNAAHRADDVGACFHSAPSNTDSKLRHGIQNLRSRLVVVF